MRRPIIVLAFLASSIMGVFHANADQPTEERLRFLMEWAGTALDRDAKKTELPRIIYVSKRDMMVQFYGPAAVARVEATPNLRLLDIRAMYLWEDKAMLLDREVDYTDPANETTLVHELTHHIQNVFDLVPETETCRGNVEKSAYKAANLWAMASGHGQVADALVLFLTTSCQSSM